LRNVEEKVPFEWPQETFSSTLRPVKYVYADSGAHPHLIDPGTAVEDSSTLEDRLMGQ
jgi:hypothetical protein